MVEAVAGHGQGALQGHGVGVADVDAVQAFGHDQGVGAVGGEVEVVGVGDRDGLPGSAGGGVDRDQVVAEVVVDPQGLQVPAGHDVLGLVAGGVAGDDLVGVGVDDLQGVGEGVGHVDQRLGGAGGAAQRPGAVVGVDVHPTRRRRGRPRRCRGAGCGGGRRRGAGRGGVPGRAPPRGAAAERGGEDDRTGAENRRGGPGPRGPPSTSLRHRAPGEDHQRVFSRSVTVTASRPRPARSSRMAGSAVMVPGWPRCRLTIDPLPTAVRTLARTCAAPGSV